MVHPALRMPFCLFVYNSLHCNINKKMHHLMVQRLKISLKMSFYTVKVF